jgi:hypothetical protein
MTPKEKADNLYRNFFQYSDSNYGANEFEKNWYGNVLAGERKVRKESTKQCAIIAVDQIIIALNFNQWQNTRQIDYFIEVRNEIEKI